MSGRRLPAHECPRDSFLLPLWKEQTFHAAIGRNLPGLLFLQGWLFVRKRHTGGTKNLGLGKGSLPQRGQSAVGGTALIPGMEKTCRGPTPDSSNPPFREEQAVGCHGKLQRPKVGTPLPGDISIFNFILLLNLFPEMWQAHPQAQRKTKPPLGFTTYQHFCQSRQKSSCTFSPTCRV